MFWNPPSTTKSTRHYYSKEKRFEQSLDIYQPSTSADADLPVVILVVGSGWMGHRAFVYRLCSWWNASGPKTIASLGTTCVCVRHRGAFCVLPPVHKVTEFLVLVLAVVGALTGGQWQVSVSVTLSLAGVFLALALAGQGSASLPDMWTDVTQALEWIHTHPELLMREPSTAAKGSISRMESLSSDEQSETSDSEPDATPPTTPPEHLQHHQLPPLVFGGYSSGGHVAATLLQQPQLFQRHNLPPPDELFQGILMISGMMAVRPGSITLQDKTSHNQPITISTPPRAPTWLTNLVLNTVWGAERAALIPSPLQETNPPPNLPHLLLGCRHEVFGLNWLDVFFCSKAYAKMVRARTGQAYSNYVQVESDHWNVLNSRALKEALQVELPQLVAQAAAMGEEDADNNQ